MTEEISLVNAEVLTMEDLYHDALAEVQSHDAKVVTEFLKNRLVEVQRLQSLLTKTQEEIDRITKMSVEDAAIAIKNMNDGIGRIKTSYLF